MTTKKPPRLEDDYKQWKTEIRWWEMYCDVDENSRAPMISAFLPQKYKKVALKMGDERMHLKKG